MTLKYIELSDMLQFTPSLAASIELSLGLSTTLPPEDRAGLLNSCIYLMSRLMNHSYGITF